MDNSNIKNENEKHAKTPKQKTLFVLRIVGNVLFYSILLFLFIFSIMNINGGNKNGMPNIFGRGYATVASDSMDRNGNDDNLNNIYPCYKDFKIKGFTTKDLVNLKMLNKSSRKKLKVGDVVTFWDTTLSSSIKEGYNTHRIVYCRYSYVDNNGETQLNAYDAGEGLKIYDYVDNQYTNIRSLEDGQYENLTLLSFTCEGDKTLLKYLNVGDYKYNPIENTETANTIDGDPYLVDTFTVDDTNVKAIVTSVNYGAGTFIKNIQKYWFFIFVLPLAIVLVIEVVLVIRNIILLRREKNKGATVEGQEIDLAAEKERIRAELLAELQKQGAIANAPAAAAETEEVAPTEEAIETPVEETTEEVKEENVEAADAPAEATEENTEAPAEEKVEEPETEAKEEEPVEEAATEEAAPAEEAQEEVKEEKEEKAEEATEAPAEEEKKEEPVLNNDEASNEPDMSIEENEEEPVVEAKEKKAPAKKKSTTTAKKAPAKKSSSTTKKASTSKKTTGKKAE